MYLVFDVGATTIKYAIMTDDGNILEKGKEPTPIFVGAAVNDFVEAIGSIYDKYAGTSHFENDGKLETDYLEQGEGQIQGIAMCLPGQIDVERGIVYNGGGIQYLHEARVQELIQARCNNTPVSIENDGKCAALAEIWKGNAKDVKDALVLVFGTGIGGGIIRDRKVVHGEHLLAGEMSFIITDMKRSDLDTFPPGENLMETFQGKDLLDYLPYTWTTQCSSVNMCHKIALAKGLPFGSVTGEQVYQWVREGDELVTNMLEDVYFNIAKMCLSLYVILDPEIILIGGGISAEPDYIKGIKKYIVQIKKMSNVYKDIKLDTCKFLNDSNLLGALYNFKQKYDLL